MCQDYFTSLFKQVTLGITFEPATYDLLGQHSQFPDQVVGGIGLVSL